MYCRVKPGNDDCDCCSRLPLTRLAAFAARHPLPALSAFTRVFDAMDARKRA